LVFGFWFLVLYSTLQIHFSNPIQKKEKHKKTEKEKGKRKQKKEKEKT